MARGVGYQRKYGKETKNCATCGKPFIQVGPRHLYCSKRCQPWHGKYRSNSELPSTATGALAELIVGIDLIRKGYDTFKSITPCSKFDLVAFKNGAIYKIEVKTAHKLDKGKVSFSPHRHADHDILALYVAETQEILYLRSNGQRIIL